MILTLILDAGDKVECAALGLHLFDPGGAAGGRVPVSVVALIAPYGGSWEQNLFTIRSLPFITSSKDSDFYQRGRSANGDLHMPFCHFFGGARNIESV